MTAVVSMKRRTDLTYRCWLNMRIRCLSKKSNGYRHWGGRGITICERWNIYRNFLEDMGERPPGTSLDRINNDGNYEPGNCRWATPVEQTRNNRNTRLTLEIAESIREAVRGGERKSVLATKWGVNRSLVTAIINNSIWKSSAPAPTGEVASSAPVQGAPAPAVSPEAVGAGDQMEGAPAFLKRT